MRNALFWAQYIRRVYLPEIGLLREGAFDRLLPCLADERIGRDAEAAGQQTWERLSAIAGPDSDPDELAEHAQDAELVRFQMLTGLRQALMNLFAVALHHLLEQQQLFLLRRELLPPREEHQHALLKSREFITRSGEAGVEVTALSGWDDLEELRHVANAVKHAEGQAVELLRTLRPDIFLHPLLRGAHPDDLRTGRRRVYKPLFGEDLYVVEPDLERYFEAARRFWQSYAQSLERLEQRGSIP